jgi:uncharacterized protein
MRYVSVVNASTGELLAERAMVAETPLARFLGLQGKRLLPEKSGLVLMPNNSIHTFFMRMRIDAIFVGQDGKVVKVGRQLRPWRIGPIALGALYCVELPAGAAVSTATGQTIELRARA